MKGRRKWATAEPRHVADSVVWQMLRTAGWAGGHRADGVRLGQGVWVGFMVVHQSDARMGVWSCAWADPVSLWPVLGSSSPWTLAIYFSTSLKSLILK